MEAQTSLPTADLASALTLAQELEAMTKEQMILYADQKMGLTVDSGLDPQTIKENLLRISQSRKNSARETNQTSLNTTMALDATRKKFWDGLDGRHKKPFEYAPNPPVQVKFYFLEQPGVDLQFASAEPYGIKGEVNKFGFKAHMKYHLFHGEMYVLPLLLIRHLEKKTYVAHKPVHDSLTGLQSAAIPIIKPRFLFQQMISDEENTLLAKFRENKRKEVKDETQDVSV
jgi:hypothetical protein